MTDTSANSRFFKSTILKQAVHGQHRKSIYGNRYVATGLYDRDSIYDDIAVIEAVHWARLGIQVGYLERSDALEALSFVSPFVGDAWSALKTRRFLPADHVWADIFQEQKEGGPLFNKQWFAVEDIAGAKSEFLQGIYQTLLLLWAENISDESSHYFIDTVASESESDWQSFMSGNRPMEHGNIQTVGVGLANVLNYWAEVNSLLEHSGAQPIRWRYGIKQPIRSKAPYYSRDDVLRVREWYEEIVAPNSDALIAFGREVQRIVSSSFILWSIEFVEAYFAFTGEFVNRVGDNSPGWLDARIDAFNTLMLNVVGSGGTTDILSESNTKRLWFAFSKGIEVFRATPAEGTTEASSETSTERTRIRPPKKPL
jgi:hypothetical protein